MIIVYQASGRMGNRLSTAAYYLALAQDLNESVWNPSLWRFRRYFKSQNPNRFIRLFRLLDRQIGKLLEKFVTRVAPEAIQNRLIFDGGLVVEPSALFDRAVCFSLDRLVDHSSVDSEDILLLRVFPPKYVVVPRPWFESGMGSRSKRKELAKI